MPLNPRERRYQIGQFLTSAPIGELTAEVAPTSHRLGSVEAWACLLGTAPAGQSIRYSGS